MCGSWRLDQQDLDTYRTDGLLKAPFRIVDEQLGRMRESLRSDVVLSQEVEPSQFDESSGRDERDAPQGDTVLRT